jgi:hypothetical protein
MDNQCRKLQRSYFHIYYAVSMISDELTLAQMARCGPHHQQPPKPLFSEILIKNDFIAILQG